MKKLTALFALFSLTASQLPAALTTQSGYTATTLYSGSAIGGLGTDGTSIYFGDSLSVYSMNTGGGNVQSVGSLPASDDNSIVAVNPQNGTVYAAAGSYSSPYPYQFGSFSGGSFTANNTINGAYDAAFDSSGRLYISAAHEDYTGDGTNDTAVYYYNQTDHSLTRIAETGGNSGGLAFDSTDNLFYGEDSAVYSFNAADILSAASGGPVLSLSDGTVKAATSSSYLALDEHDNLYATRLDAFWNTELVSISTNGNVSIIANGGGGHLVAIGENLYTAGTDYGDWPFSSNIYEIKAVPEPSSVLLLLLGSGGIFGFRRYKKQLGL